MSNEVADGLEIDLANAPGAIKQQHDVGLRCSVTLSVCTETVVVVGWAVVGGSDIWYTTDTMSLKSYCVREK